MIKKIKVIKNLGIFNEYRWENGLQEFKKFNLFYGWNGSGKTTLINLFSSLETGQSSLFPNLEYKVETDAGDLTQSDKYSRKIRIFNEDFINNNIDMLKGRAKPIFIVGKDKSDLLKSIDADEKLLSMMNDKLLNAKKDLDNNTKSKERLFTDVAKLISQNTTGTSSRTYRKNNAEASFKALKGKTILNSNQINIHRTTLRQDIKPVLSPIQAHEINDQVTAIENNAAKLLACTVKTRIIEKLRDNPDISKWVEDGLRLHNDKNLDVCEFCNQPIPKMRLSELLEYFNDADRKLKDDINKLISAIDDLQKSVNEIVVHDKANLYDEFQSGYHAKQVMFNDAKKNFMQRVNSLKSALSDKKSNTTSPVDFQVNINITLLLTPIHDLNGFIKLHNEKTKSFAAEQDKASKELENHYLSEIFDDVEKYEKKAGFLEGEIRILNNGDGENPGIDLLKNRIMTNKEAVARSGPACKTINEKLNKFLGRDELAFEVFEDGYIIKRKGQIANNLSEGEKTAIAFIYFTIQLVDRDFDIREGIVVIDDPISSLDSNSIYQAFSFLKNTVEDAKQVFLFTHNFDFLKLLINWLKNCEGNNKCYYMIKNPIINNNRVAKICELDKLLTAHESEYHYLFHLLYSYAGDGTISTAYSIPNIARKVLDYFLMFSVPNNKSLYQKLEKIDYDPLVKTAIYKFVNDASHITGNGFNPALVEQAPTTIKNLLAMIETVNSKHYNYMVEEIHRTHN